MKHAIVSLVLCALNVSGQTLSGDWINHFFFRDARDYTRVVLQQNGDQLTGTAGPAKLVGTFREGRIELTSTVGNRTTKASGTFDGNEVKGKADINGEEVNWRMYRPKSRPESKPRVHDFEPKEFHRVFSGAIPPVLHIFPGDTVRTWTVDAGGVDSKGVRRSNGGNPETGPFYIEGALPGDVIAIKLNKVRLNRDTAMSSPGIAAHALNPYYVANLEKVTGFKADWKLDREKGIARLAEPTEKLKDFTIPLRPMLGCIGVAPQGDMVFRTGYPGQFGGNMDYNELREGVTVYLPVYQLGALLFVGDGHAAQGDGELTGNALETSMDVEFTVDLIPGGGRSQNGPRAENDEYLMAMGIAGSLTDAFQTATTEMSRWLARDYGLNPAEISAVLGTSIRYDIAEVVDPLVNVVAKISKRALAPLKKQSP